MACRMHRFMLFTLWLLSTFSASHALNSTAARRSMPPRKLISKNAKAHERQKKARTAASREVAQGTANVVASAPGPAGTDEAARVKKRFSARFKSGKYAAVGAPAAVASSSSGNGPSPAVAAARTIPSSSMSSLFGAPTAPDPLKDWIVHIFKQLIGR